MNATLPYKAALRNGVAREFARIDVPSISHGGQVLWTVAQNISAKAFCGSPKVRNAITPQKIGTAKPTNALTTTNRFIDNDPGEGKDLRSYLPPRTRTNTASQLDPYKWGRQKLTNGAI